MRLFILIVAPILLFVSAQATDLANSVLDHEIKVGEAEPLPAKSEVSRLFHFEPFKRAYHKHYQSTMEEMRRLKTYLARCYQIFVSAVGYSRGLKSYFLRVSEWTDLLPEEIEAGKNKFASLADLQNTEALRGDKAEMSAADHEGTPIKQEDRAQVLGEPKPTRKRRRKRDTGDSRPSFSIEEAFVMKTDDTPVEDSNSKDSPLRCLKEPETGLKRVASYASRPDYKSTAAMEFKLRDGRTYDNLPVKGNYNRLSLTAKIHRRFLNEGQLTKQIDTKRIQNSNKDDHSSDDNGDVLWMDHRICGCFQPVQSQGICGSCYAFAMIGYLEWLHCSTTTERIKLSEQYIVDCGRQLDDSLHGCSGGNYFKTGEFISNFGLEPAESYPYFGFENKCPHERGKDLHSMGYLRADASNFVVIDMKYAEHYLDKWVILVNIYAGDDFLWYGGGVWVGKTCGQEEKNMHSVLIVGHGREDDEEYWLIRNSHGISWGERGYMKLNKNSQCIMQSRGFFFGTSNGMDLRLSIKRNDKVSEPIKPRPSLMSSVFHPRQAIKILANSP